MTCCLLAYFISWQPIFKNGSIFLGVLNLGLLSYYFKRIKAELSESSKIDHILHLYSSIFEKIENTPFESQVLKDLSASFHKDRVVASERISRLSSLYAQLDNIQNPFGAFLFNGLFLFHFHVLRKLYRWKKAHAEDVVEWMSNFGELESLCSLANFYFNNPSYCFPSINENRVLNFEKLGHPLLAPDVRIPNSLDLRQQSFVILTGSNMSGKSTYLRCLGVNMVLAKMGAPICATKADIHPMQILASMRLSDSLHDSESYFFAEVKRLQFIMEQSENEDSFILLDEILRGTNSEDKREGTIEVIKKLCGRSVFGAIATHDLKVCATTDLYPDTLVNKCFEVETVHDELIFDYKLRDGICQNKSASFLMRKMGVI